MCLDLRASRAFLVAVATIRRARARVCDRQRHASTFREAFSCDESTNDAEVDEFVDELSTSRTTEQPTDRGRRLWRRFTYLSIISGIGIGALGLTGLKGFALHGVFMLLTGLGVTASKCEGRPSTYFPSIDKVFLDGPNSGLATFVLFWTLSYNCCHLF